MTTVAPQLRLSIQTGIITTEDGPQIISTLNPLESSSHHTLRGRSFTSGCVHGQRIKPSRLESEIIRSSGNKLPEGCRFKTATVTAPVRSQHNSVTWHKSL